MRLWWSAQYLAGVGIARQRQAIINGLKDSVVSFSSEIPGTTPQEIMDMMMLTQVRSRPLCLAFWMQGT